MAIGHVFGSLSETQRGPKQDVDGVPGSGGTTPGTRKFLRVPTWTIGIQQLSNSDGPTRDTVRKKNKRERTKIRNVKGPCGANKNFKNCLKGKVLVKILCTRYCPPSWALIQCVNLRALLRGQCQETNLKPPRACCVKPALSKKQ